MTPLQKIKPSKKEIIKSFLEKKAALLHVETTDDIKMFNRKDVDNVNDYMKLELAHKLAIYMVKENLITFKHRFIKGTYLKSTRAELIIVKPNVRLKK